LKVAHLNRFDIVGGAARAAYRIHHALRCQDVDSHMYVESASAGDWTVQFPQSKLAKSIGIARRAIGGLLTKTLKTSNPIIHSPAILPSNWLEQLNKSDVDIINLHWINGEMLSVADIGHLQKPVVWTLHDMWAFCGAEHYIDGFRWRDGYSKHNRPTYEQGFDLNRWTWQRKRRHWHHPLQIVTPSQWLAGCVRESALMRDWPVTVIPNAIDTDHWQPIGKVQARKLLHLPLDVPLLLFGAMWGMHDPRKGFDLLKEALNHLRGQIPGLELLIFGQLAPQKPLDLGFPVHFTGHLHDDISLRLLYSAADLMVIPSRQDNLPNTGLEANACGTPVVAFNTCGLPDIVTHHKSGYLAKAFDAEDLARGIQWILSNPERYAKLSTNAREDAVARFSYPVIAKTYKFLYEQVLATM
jgi:glycosyltransferase involved in cell wall biosynthesis